MEYPISGYAFHGRSIKRVQASDKDGAIRKVARWALHKFPYLSKHDVDENVIVSELGQEPNVFEEGDVSITFPYDEPPEELP